MDPSLAQSPASQCGRLMKTLSCTNAFCIPTCFIFPGPSFLVQKHTLDSPLITWSKTHPPRRQHFHHAPPLRTNRLSFKMTELKRRKSLTQSIRACLSRQNSRDSQYAPSRSASGQGDEPPISLIPGSYSISVTAEDLTSAWSTITPPPFPSPMAYTACYCEENIYLLTQQLSSLFISLNETAIRIAIKQSKSCRKEAGATSNVGGFVPVWDLYTLFISNKGRTVLLYDQKASKLPNAGWPVIWDYHVISLATCHLVPITALVLDENGNIAIPCLFKDKTKAGLEWGKSWVYDFDSRLSQPSQPRNTLRVVPWNEYKQHTFHPDASVPQHFRPKFRLIQVKDYLDWFASDRSHMLNREGEWSANPPVWDCIVGKEARKRGVENNLMQSWVEMSTDSGSRGEEEGRYGMVWDGKEFLKMDTMVGDGLGTTVGQAEGRRRRKEVVKMEEKIVKASQKKHQQESQNNEENREDDMLAVEKKEEESQRGGRIASPLFPAYLYASQSHRSLLPPPPPPSSTI